MNKKGWNSILNLFFIGAAIVIGIIMFIYTTTEINIAQGTNNATGIANSTSTIIESYPIMNSLLYVVLAVGAFAIVLWILFIFIKFFQEKWVSGI